MEISTEHISQTNIGNTDSPSLIPKYLPTINPHIATVFVPKTNINNIADNLQVLITRSYIYIGPGLFQQLLQFDRPTQGQVDMVVRTPGEALSLYLIHWHKATLEGQSDAGCLPSVMDITHLQS